MRPLFGIYCCQIAGQPVGLMDHPATASVVPCVHSIIRFCYTLGEFNNIKTKLCTPEEAYHEIH